MKKTRNWIIGLSVVALLAVGVAAVAGNGFGQSATWNAPQAAAGDCGACDAQEDCALADRDADGDGICNAEDTDWVRPLDGTGYGTLGGCGLNQASERPLDGSGFGAGRGCGMGTGTAGGFGRGGCS